MTFGYEQYERERYKGKPALLIARASTLTQEVSTRDQFADMSKLVNDIGATVAGKMAYEGVSASKTWDRKDLVDIENRNKFQKDFQIIIWYDPTRLTRGGAGHGHAVMFRLRGLNLRVLFSAQREYNLPHGDQLLTTAFEQARLQVVTLAASTCRGAHSAIKENRMLGPSNTWYGVDRLYLMPDMTPRHILRTLADGTQVVHEVNTENDGGETIYKMGNLLQTFAPINSEQASRYRKQDSDFVFAIPGDPEQTSAVYSMFQWSIIDRDGRPTISRALNERGILAPRGGLWTDGSVYHILNQPIYLGYHYLNQGSCSSNRTRADGGYKPVFHEDAAVEAGCVKPPMRWSNRKDWQRKDQPFMAPFFGDEIYRNLVQEFVERRLDVKSSRRGIRGDMNKHRRSEYILTGILETQHSGIKMAGRKTGNNKYYYPKNYSTVRKELDYASVCADEANQVVVDALSLSLRDRPGLAGVIGRSIEDHRSSVGRSEDERKHLEDQIAKLKREQKFITKRIHIIGESEAEEQLAENRDQQDKLKLQLDTLISSASALDQCSPSMVEAVLDELGRIGNTLAEAPAPTVKGLLEVFVESAVADLNTRNLEFVFRLPSWAVIEPSKICAGASLCLSTGSDTNNYNSIILKTIGCLWTPGKRGRGGHKGFYTIIERLGKSESQSETSQVDSEPNDQAVA